MNILTPSGDGDVPGVEKNISATSTASKQINWSPNLVSVAPPPTGNADANVTLTPPTSASSNPTISFQLEHQASTGSADSVPVSRSNLSMNSPVRFLGVNHPGVIQ